MNNRKRTARAKSDNMALARYHRPLSMLQWRTISLSEDCATVSLRLESVTGEANAHLRMFLLLERRLLSRKGKRARQFVTIAE